MIIILASVDMKAHELIHNGLYILGESEVVRFYALNGHFYSLSHGGCIGQAYQHAESGEISCLVGGNNWMEVKPIPLTAEILEKNGWRYIQPSKLMFIPDDGGSISYRVETHYVEVGYDGSVRKNMGFVHEFQHALHLCGLNDLADNFKV